MPFTLAHPAAVLPLMRRPLVGLALVCGAMAPDIPYYVRATRLPVTAQSWYEPFTNATTSHSPSGLLLVTLPLALLTYLFLFAAARPVEWLARGERSEAPLRAGAPSPTLMGWVWVLVSLVLGILTHLVWDSATSSNGFLAANLPVLNDEGMMGLSWTRLLQHASTVLGLGVIAVVLWRRRRTLSIPEPALRRRCRAAVAGIVAVGLVAGTISVLVTVDLSPFTGPENLVETVLATLAMGGGAAAVIVVALGVMCWWFWHLGRRRPNPTRRRRRPGRCNSTT